LAIELHPDRVSEDKIAAENYRRAEGIDEGTPNSKSQLRIAEKDDRERH